MDEALIWVRKDKTRTKRVGGCFRFCSHLMNEYGLLRIFNFLELHISLPVYFHILQ